MFTAIRTHVFRFVAIVAFAAAASVVRRAQAADAPDHTPDPAPNVLLICVDDLRPQLGAYGCAEMSTPSIDRLAAEGRLFERHYVQVPTCGASRAALLTGRYPSRRSDYDNGALAARAKDAAPAHLLSLPELFRRHGYTTVAIGKITHEPGGRLPDGKPELPGAWDECGTPAGKWGGAWGSFFAYADGSTRVPGKSPATERADVADEGYPDGLIARDAVEALRRLKDRPFFLAVGFFKPHLPFNAPARYWDLYDPAKLPPIPNPRPPAGVDPTISLHRSPELTPRYAGLATPGVVTDAEARHLRHGYDACVSYADAQVGKVLRELDEIGLRDRTIVVLWGDHGWHLGEQGVWGKHTLYEVALRSPLIVRTPGQPAPGQAAAGLVESVDVFPTLAALCGLEPPGDLAGSSFAPILADPRAPGKRAAYGFWAGGRAHTVRTDRYRLTRWTDANDPPRVVQVELYDHDADPHEMRNVAADHPEVVGRLTDLLRQNVPVLRDR